MGTKSFVLLCRINGQFKRMTLGRYSVLSLADARNLANEALFKIKPGENPQAEKEAAPTFPHFDDALNQFIRLHCNRPNRDGTTRETERLLQRSQALLAALTRPKPTYVYPARRNDAGSLSGVSKHKRNLDGVSKVTNWTLHELRHTTASDLAQMGGCTPRDCSMFGVDGTQGRDDLGQPVLLFPIDGNGRESDLDYVLPTLVVVVSECCCSDCKKRDDDITCVGHCSTPQNW